MRRWLRVLLVGVLTILISIDTASACRFLRSRPRLRPRVVTCRASRPTSAPTPWQCCVPADGSAHAVVDDADETAPTITSIPPAGEPEPAPPRPTQPPLPLEPVAPASAEKPIPAPVPLSPEPVAEPQFRSAAEILAESAEQQRREQAALEAAAPVPPPAPPTPEPKFKTAAEILAESAAEEAAVPPSTPAPPPAVAEAPAEQPMAKEPAPPADEPAAPATKPAPENLFDDGDDPADDADPGPRRPIKKPSEPTRAAQDNLFDEPDAPEAHDSPPPRDEEPLPADEPPAEEPAAAEADPSAVLEPPAEPVRRWIDDTGRHETIGRLVAIRPDAVRILKDNGRHATVPLARLSRHDRAYVATTGARLAAEQGRPQAPAVTDTARR